MTIQAILNSTALNQRTDLITLARTGIQTKYVKEIQGFTSFSDKELSSILPISQRQLIR
jgi:hypothetical protein